MIVMKFGGTSVGSAERIRGVHRIVASLKSRRPIVVVSAVGGITDRLLQACKGALAGQDPAALAGAIRQTHEAICADLKQSTVPLEPLFHELEGILKGIYYVGEVTPRTKDRVASFGERLSARITAQAMTDNGLPAVAYDAWEVGMVTTSDFTSARLLPETDAHIAAFFQNYEAVPVVTGFIAKDKRGDITTLGRGGSDFSAAIIGGALGVEEIQIWTDVPGILTCDPRHVKEARVLAEVSFAEAAELAYFGAKVLHPKTIEPAVKRGIPVVVKNSFAPEDPGTTVRGSVEAVPGGVRAITSKSNITMLNLYSTGMLEAPGFLAKIFRILHEHELSVDVIATSEVHVSLTLDNTDSLDEALVELQEVAEVDVAGGRSIVCLVGEGIKTTPGVAGRVFSVLAREHINVEMISQGASRVNISFVIPDEARALAVKALHETFFEAPVSV